MKMLPIKAQDGGYQNREAIEPGNQARTKSTRLRGVITPPHGRLKKQILDEIIEVTNFHRKHALRHFYSPAARSNLATEHVNLSWEVEILQYCEQPVEEKG
jgi:hypothetical protein